MAGSRGKPLEQVVRGPEWYPQIQVIGAKGSVSEGIKEPVSADFRCRQRTSGLTLSDICSRQAPVHGISVNPILLFMHWKNSLFNATEVLSLW